MSEQQPSFINSTIASAEAKSIASNATPNIKSSKENANDSTIDTLTLDRVIDSPKSSTEVPSQDQSKVKEDPTSTTLIAPIPAMLNLNSLFPTEEEQVVSSVLQQVVFSSQSILYLMVTKKLQTFSQLQKLTQDEWNDLIKDNPCGLKDNDFDKIVVFHEWWNDQGNLCPVKVAFSFTKATLDSIMNENYDVAASPLSA